MRPQDGPRELLWGKSNCESTVHIFGFKAMSSLATLIESCFLIVQRHNRQL